MTYVDYDTQKRYPKESAKFLIEVFSVSLALSRVLISYSQWFNKHDPEAPERKKAAAVKPLANRTNTSLSSTTSTAKGSNESSIKPVKASKPMFGGVRKCVGRYMTAALAFLK